MKLKEKLAQETNTKWMKTSDCYLEDGAFYSYKHDNQGEAMFIAGFEKCREIYRKKIEETVKKLKNPEDKSALLTAIVYSVDVGEEEV